MIHPVLQSVLSRSFEPAMVVSVIIVNYNVKYFLEQCLCSLFTAGRLLESMEVFVVDNASSDGSHQYLASRFPAVKWMLNAENKGFGVANNQALGKAKGEYILFLNPDTLLPEDSLLRCVDFIRSHPDAGAVGVRMIDGSGSYLKESKRGFPTPWVAFCKMSGLTSVFPKNKHFSGYYKGNLPENEVNRVDALAGAFMLIRKKVLDQTGGFDERFFMYAEDIDLCYRIFKAGFQNYYFPLVTIVHFKGESTRKNAEYIKHFYNAMILFVRKHSVSPFQKMISFILEGAIHFRALVARLIIKDHDHETPTHPFHPKLLGDVNSIKELGGILTESASKTDEILYCEGENMPFSKIIAKIQEKGHQQKIYFHALGSRSIVGSPTSKSRGIFIPFDKE